MYKKGILVFLLFFWICLATFNVFYNSIKTVYEIKDWYPLSENQKLEKIFGPTYEFSAFVNDNTPENSKISFYSQEGMPFFYARYYLYPRHVYWQQDTVEYVKDRYPKEFDFVALYNMNVPLVGFEKIATFSAKNSNITGSLHKRK